MKNKSRSFIGAAMAAVLATRGAMLANRVFGAAAVRDTINRARKSGKKNIARSKYMPHQGKQEIARRLRKAGRTV